LPALAERTTVTEVGARLIMHRQAKHGQRRTRADARPRDGAADHARIRHRLGSAAWLPCFAHDAEARKDATHRRKDTSAAAEVQQATLPPRIARVSGAALAGNVLPGYEVGGDWFDYVENPGGTWLGIADAIGNGAAAAALGAIALGAFRAGRRSDDDLGRIVASMHETLARVGGANDSVAVTIARWHGASSNFTWISCGNPRPMRIDTAGRLEILGRQSPPLGTPEAHAFTVEQIRLLPGERLVLASDGVTERPTGDGTPLGADGVRQAAAAIAPTSAAETVKAIEDAVLHASSAPLEDDATLIVLAPVDAPTP
jgi:serine phosphatase RsbU (regulator of sigma subunit)